jgi:hypothetical protein
MVSLILPKPLQIGEGAGKEFQWWDHLYNKAANNIVVSNDVCVV